MEFYWLNRHVDKNDFCKWTHIVHIDEIKIKVCEWAESSVGNIAHLAQRVLRI